jgi:hypothetical protein
MRTFVLAAALAIAATGALAQVDSMPARDLPQNGGVGVRTGNITSTGATVPNPGQSQSGGTSQLDVGVQRQDNKIDSSICKGC